MRKLDGLTASCKKPQRTTKTEERGHCKILGHHTNKRFWEEYRKLRPAIRNRADRQFAILKANPNHPSLQFKKVVEKRGLELWSARVSLNYRALAIKQPNDYVWFWIGEHETYELLIQ